jgi:8-oxo-dGTP pyrophosphatase MutT (NUDIX family)
MSKIPKKVIEVGACRLSVGESRWGFEDEHARQIDDHWARRSAESSRFFNGIIHLLEDGEIGPGGYEGRLLRTDFKSYLYWRDTEFPEAGVRDAFGSALIRSAEGHVVLGRQREGNINAGLTYLPGGFIDPRDIGGDGVVDIDGSVARELAEETGLVIGTHLVAEAGYLLTFSGPLVSVACRFRSPLGSAVLGRLISDHIAADRDAELAAPVIVSCREDLAGLSMPSYAHVLLDHLLD